MPQSDVVLITATFTAYLLGTAGVGRALGRRGGALALWSCLHASILTFYTVLVVSLFYLALHVALRLDASLLPAVLALVPLLAALAPELYVELRRRPLLAGPPMAAALYAIWLYVPDAPSDVWSAFYWALYPLAAASAVLGALEAEEG